MSLKCVHLAPKCVGSLARHATYLSNCNEGEGKQTCRRMWGKCQWDLPHNTIPNSKISNSDTFTLERNVFCNSQTHKEKSRKAVSDGHVTKLWFEKWKRGKYVVCTLDIKKQGMNTRNATWLRTTGVSAGSCPVLCIHTTNAAIQTLMSFFFSNPSIKLPFLTKNPKKPHEDKDNPCKKNLHGCWNTGQTERAPIQSGFFRYFNFVHNLLQEEEISYCKGWWFW